MKHAAFAIAAIVAVGCTARHGAASPPLLHHACQTIDYTINHPYPPYSNVAIAYRIDFAKNNAVQSYTLIKSSKNPEADHLALLDLRKLYGPELVNAPPLRIVSYRKKSKNFSVPDRAIDSCGRSTFFQ